MIREDDHGEPAEALSPVQWAQTLSDGPVASRRLPGSAPVLVRRWRGICPDIEQPPLDHHYITLHLGGPKRIRRTGDGREAHNEIADGAYSVTPAGSAFQWRTEGPVDFAHLYLRPARVDEVTLTEFDRDARHVALHDALGARDPLMEALLAVVADSLTSEKEPSRAYWDGLTHTLMCRLLYLHSTVASAVQPARHALAPGRVAKVRTFVEDNLDQDIGLFDLAAVAGVSAFHFSRCFRRATGFSPCAFVTHRRVARARMLLQDTDLPLIDVSRACGFGSHSRFSILFKRETGVCPRHYRFRR